MYNHNIFFPFLRSHSFQFCFYQNIDFLPRISATVFLLFTAPFRRRNRNKIRFTQKFRPIEQKINLCQWRLDIWLLFTSENFLNVETRERIEKLPRLCARQVARDCSGEYGRASWLKTVNEEQIGFGGWKMGWVGRDEERETRGASHTQLRVERVQKRVRKTGGQSCTKNGASN